MPRYIDGSGEDQKYFDQVQRATAGQVNRDAGLMSSRDAARALFSAGVKGAATPQQMSGENYRSLELIEYSPDPIPLISTQFIFNRTTTPDMVANPTNYRAVAESLFVGASVTLAGVITGGGAPRPPPTLPILPYTNSVGIDATNSLCNGTSRLTASLPILLYDSQMGVQSSTLYPYGIGFRIRFNTARTWTITIQYYNAAGAFVASPVVIANNLAFTNGQLINGVLTMTRANAPLLANTNVDIFLNMKAATIVPPLGFDPPPAGITTFDGTSLAATPKLIWDAV
jgi:hypothetical protein